MFIEEILPEFEPALGKVDKFAVAQKEFRTPRPANPKADIVANNRARRRAGDDKGEAKLTRGPGVAGGENQNGFSGQRNAGALEHNDKKNHPIAVLCDEGLNLGQ